MTQPTFAAPPRSRNSLAQVYWMITGWADKMQSPFLLFIRIYIGYQCIISGWAHLHNIQQTTDFFVKLRIPLPELNVIVSATTELFGGCLLLVGLASRPVSAVLAVNFIVAIVTVELSNYDFSWRELGAQIWKDQSPIIGDTAFPFLATALVVLLFGPGWFSIDGIIRFLQKKK